MGQKIHPVGFRLGVNRDADSKWYARPRAFASALHEDHLVRKYIKEKVASGVISRVEIVRQGNSLHVAIHTSKPGIVIGQRGKGADDLTAALGKMTKRQVQVKVFEVRHPDIDAQLVAESVAQQIEKRIAYKRAMRQAVLRAMKLGAKGIRIMCSGRLAGAEMARREKDRQGKIPLQTLRADIDYGFAEALTAYGHIGIKVWIYRGDLLPGQMRPSEPEVPRGYHGEGRPDRSGERQDRGMRGRGAGRGGPRGPRRD